MAFTNSIIASALLLALVIVYIEACGNVQKKTGVTTTTRAPARKRRSIDEHKIEFITSLDFDTNKTNQVIDSINQISNENNMNFELNQENTKESDVNGKLRILYSMYGERCDHVGRFARLVEENIEEVKYVNINC